MSPARHLVALAAVAGLCLAAPATAADSAPSASASVAKAKTYKNCTALNKVYPHGVGKPNARDKTSGTPVTNFKRSKALYQANTKSDRDKDGIACEKK
ncbi:excalibur calcium-binding domain-containing protein [Nocardioides lijunqiniae]|uniref:excalibur calcium-binding domain-containing protein n=1 Tax=Nocardioides lijunqiniae TaxID=2760832 RepID=UPI001878E9E3|nr:excalibur calcium-binding domain-containing protein [Nocardioides lijunqiniae]